tara:strand:+ start:5328 stop:6782 length:1455 start_codon:yes stop_codon:yes gene_type:complete
MAKEIKHDELKEIIHLTRGSLLNTGLGLFPENLRTKSSPLHVKLSDTLVNSERSTAFAFPRGFGKSTYCWELLSAWNILHRKYRYIMFIGSTSTIAEDMFANVRAQLTSHPLLGAMIKIVKNTSSKFFYQINGVNYFLACYGAGQQLRGKRFDAIRPELVVMDDLETTEGVRSQEQRKKMKDWLFADVLPLDVNCRFFYIGTMLHEDCLLANLISEPLDDERTGQKWATMRFGVIDDLTGEPTWPEKYDESWINTERKKYIANNMLYRFNTEYMNVAVARDDRTFDPTQIRFFNPAQLDSARNGGMDILLTVDPGIHGDGDHDPTVIMATAMDREGNLWILDVSRRHMIHHEILDEIVRMYRLWNPNNCYIEAVQAQQYLVQDLEHGTWPGGDIIKCEPINGKQIRLGKQRIYGIESLFHQRKLLVPTAPVWWVDFMDELVSFPRGKHDDMLDCVAYAKMNHVQPMGQVIDVQAYLNPASSTVF